MSVTLEPVFNALGYQAPEQKRSLVKLLQAAGAFGQLPGVTGVINDRQADAILANVTFGDAKQAAQWLHDLTQETMKRPEGQARTDTLERGDFAANRSELVEALKALGVIDGKKPTQAHYDHVLLLGAKEPTAETRLATIQQLWEEGIRFDKLHLLGSDRPLDTAQEPIANATGDNGDTLSTETEMLKAHYYTMRDAWSDELKAVPTFAVNSYDRDDRHANTKDTIETWLAMHPEPDHGNVLVISNQPYVAYQDAAVRSVLPEGYHIETVGTAIDPQDINVTLAMDAFARQIDVNFDKLTERLESQSSDLSAASLTLLDPADIKTDPQTYQFRAHYDASGVTEAGRFHAQQWDPILHGDPLLVHERLDGTLYVADGHHRLNLAQTLNNEGRGPGRVAAMVLREADGYTPEDVKIIAAYKNIAHGKNDPIEAAKVFKEAYSGKVHTEYLPQLQMDKGDLRLSFSLSKLSDKALDEVAQKQIPLDMAAEVASRVADPHGQESVLEVISEDLKTQLPPDGFAARFGSRKPVESFVQREAQRQAGEPSHNLSA